MSRDLPGRGGWEVLELTGTLRRRISECRLSQLRRDLGVKQEQKKARMISQAIAMHIVVLMSMGLCFSFFAVSRNESCTVVITSTATI